MKLNLENLENSVNSLVLYLNENSQEQHGEEVLSGVAFYREILWSLAEIAGKPTIADFLHNVLLKRDREKLARAKNPLQFKDAETQTTVQKPVSKAEAGTSYVETRTFGTQTKKASVKKNSSGTQTEATTCSASTQTGTKKVTCEVGSQTRMYIRNSSVQTTEIRSIKRSTGIQTESRNTRESGVQVNPPIVKEKHSQTQKSMKKTSGCQTEVKKYNSEVITEIPYKIIKPLDKVPPLGKVLESNFDFGRFEKSKGLADVLGELNPNLEVIQRQRAPPTAIQTPEPLVLLTEINAQRLKRNLPPVITGKEFSPNINSDAETRRAKNELISNELRRIYEKPEILTEKQPNIIAMNGICYNELKSTEQSARENYPKPQISTGKDFLPYNFANSQRKRKSESSSKSYAERAKKIKSEMASPTTEAKTSTMTSPCSVKLKKLTLKDYATDMGQPGMEVTNQKEQKLMTRSDLKKIRNRDVHITAVNYDNNTGELNIKINKGVVDSVIDVDKLDFESPEDSDINFEKSEAAKTKDGIEKPQPKVFDIVHYEEDAWKDGDEFPADEFPDQEVASENLDISITKVVDPGEVRPVSVTEEEGSNWQKDVKDFMNRKIKCDICDEEFTYRGISNHKKSHTYKAILEKIACKFCDKECKSEMDRQNHYKSEHSETKLKEQNNGNINPQRVRKIKCPICEKEISWQGYVSHKKSHKPKNSSDVINIDEVDGNSNKLPINKENVENPTSIQKIVSEVCEREVREKNVICVVCRKEFGDAKNYINHKKFCIRSIHNPGDLTTHGTKNDFVTKCKDCGVGFYYTFGLERHIALMHTKTTIEDVNNKDLQKLPNEIPM